MVINFCRLLIEATTLDAFDLTYEFSFEALNTLSVMPFSRLKRGILPRAGIFLWHWCQSLVQLGFGAKTDIPTGSLVFFVMSENEADSLKPVQSKMMGAYLTGSREAPHPFPFFWAYALSCIYLPLVVLSYCKTEGHRRKSFEYVFDHYWLIYGLYITARIWLRRLRPKAFVFANQVSSYLRVLQKAASDESIPTFCLQHASIQENYPPLTSDYALIEGQDTLVKLVQAGTTKPKTFLIGMPKHDAHYPYINTRSQVRSLGICTSSQDPVPRVEQLLMQIRHKFPTLPLILRPKTEGARIRHWRDLADQYDMGFSDSRTELSFDFLRKVDAIIAGDSNILLEAALMNVVPLYYDFAQAHLDWYGFQRNGLVEYFSEPSEVCRYLREVSANKPSVRIRARRYCATVGTRYEGHSGELAAALIQALVSGSQVSLEGWRQIPNIGLEAYELIGDDPLAVLERCL